MSPDTEEWLTTKEVLNHLREAGITNSEPQVRKWLKDGSIPGSTVSDNRKSGRRTPKSSVIAFIRKRNPLYRRIELLEADNAQLRRRTNELSATIDQVKGELETIRKKQRDIKLLLGKLIPKATTDQSVTFAFRIMSNFWEGLNEQQIGTIYQLLRDHSSDIIDANQLEASPKNQP